MFGTWAPKYDAGVPAEKHGADAQRASSEAHWVAVGGGMVFGVLVLCFTAVYGVLTHSAMASRAADNLAAHAEAQCGEVEVNHTMVYAGMVLVITAVLFKYKRLCAANNEAVVRAVNDTFGVDALNACAVPAQHRAPRFCAKSRRRRGA